MTRLDLESPAPADPSKWTEAVRLMRLTNAKGGMIAGNILFGGPIEFFDGPWQFVNNDLRGIPAGTYSHGVFTGHATHDVTIKGNRVKPIEPSGKIWRFLVLTHRTRAIGSKTTSSKTSTQAREHIPWSNEPEIMLTEAYHLTYEGAVSGLSINGRLIRIHNPQGRPPPPETCSPCFQDRRRDSTGR